MRHRLTIMAAFFMLAAGSAHAQYSETNNLFYFTQRTPQSNMLNPAFFPSAFYLQLPGLNSLQLGLPLSIGDIVHYDAEQQANIIDLNNVLTTLGEDNQFRLGADINLVGLGLRVGSVFVDANMQLKTNFNLGLPIDAINFVLNGNVQPDGTAYPEMPILDGDFFNAQMYLETSVGAGLRVPMTNLTVGAHVKLLSGLVNLNTDNTKVTFETDPDYESVRAKIYYEVMGSSVIPIDSAQGLGLDMFKNIQVNDVLQSVLDINGGNTGLAFDIGAKYDLGPFTISASINDISTGIHWQKNVVSLVPTGGQGTIEFNGMDIANLLDRGSVNFDTLTEYLNEQMKAMTPEFKVNEGDYWYNIPTKMNLAATVNLGLLKAGILMHGQWDRGLLARKTINSASDLALDLGEDGIEGLKNTFRFNTTVSAGINLFNWIELVVGSSMVYDGHSKITIDNFLNPGVGLILTPATLVQAYVMMDYASSMYFTQMKAFNFKLGFNLVVGSNKKSRIL